MTFFCDICFFTYISCDMVDVGDIGDIIISCDMVDVFVVNFFFFTNISCETVAQVGDQRKHLAVLLTLRTELDAKGQPTDNLHPEVK